jgi:hypothetical protein
MQVKAEGRKPDYPKYKYRQMLSARSRPEVEGYAEEEYRKEDQQ